MCYKAEIMGGGLPSFSPQPRQLLWRGGRQLITDKPLSLLLANSPAPFSLPLSLPFFCLSPPLYHFTQRTVFLCSKLGWRRFYPWRIRSGLQSCDDCRHECCRLASLAPLFFSITAPCFSAANLPRGHLHLVNSY